MTLLNWRFIRHHVRWPRDHWYSFTAVGHWFPWFHCVTGKLLILRSHHISHVHYLFKFNIWLKLHFFSGSFKNKTKQTSLSVLCLSSPVKNGDIFCQQGDFYSFWSLPECESHSSQSSLLPKVPVGSAAALCLKSKRCECVLYWNSVEYVYESEVRKFVAFLDGKGGGGKRGGGAKDWWSRLQKVSPV